MKMKIFDQIAGLSGWRYYLICLVIGAIGILGHAPYFLWPVTMVMFAILFHLLTLTLSAKRAFWTGMVVGTGYFTGQVYWIAEAFIARGAEFVYIMPFLVGGLALLLASFWGIAGWVFKKFKSETTWPYLTLAGLIFLAEMTRGHLFGGFPWGLPGYIFKAGGFMSQTASFLGIYGLSLAVLLVSALAARTLSTRTLLPGFIAAGLLVSGFGYGMARLSAADVKFVENVKIRIIAAPFSQKDKLDPNKPWVASDIVQDHLNLTAEPGLEDITHVIWPEGVLDFDIRRIPNLRLAMGQTLRDRTDNPPLWILNSVRLDEQENGFDYYNSTAVFDFANRPDGEVIAVSDKKRLVPFGEIIPGGKLVEKLGARVISENIGSFTPARKKSILDVPGLPSGSVQICYEVIFSGFTPRESSRRAQWLLNQSNDAWFGEKAGPYQHANIARYRAIEEKAPLIRAASNGFSGMADPYGRYVKYAEPYNRKAIDVRLPQALGESLSFKWLNVLWALLCFALLLIHRWR